MKAEFKHPMTVLQRVMGLMYLPIHGVLLPLLLSRVVLPRYPGLEVAYLDLALYLAGALFCLIALHSFLKRSFSDIIDEPGRFLKFLVVCALMYLSLTTVTGLLLNLVLEEGELINPNTDAVSQLLGRNYNITVVTTVILAPILEECLFRGALFGTIRRKSRPAAYIVTIIVFSMYHLWSYFVFAYDHTLWLYLPQYVPATLALCVAYEKGGSIWCPILLHAAINCLALYAQRFV